MNPICVLVIKLHFFQSSCTEQLPPNSHNQKGTDGGWTLPWALPLSWSKTTAEGSSPWRSEKDSHTMLLNWSRERKGLYGAWEKSQGQIDGGNVTIPVPIRAPAGGSVNRHSPHPIFLCGTTKGTCGGRHLVFSVHVGWSVCGAGGGKRPAGDPEQRPQSEANSLAAEIQRLRKNSKVLTKKVYF